jgi:hypothetical protein
MSDLWTYRDTAWGSEGTATAELGRTDVAGFSVEALDGSIGKVDEATYDVGASYIVVDTGPWILGKKVLLPAGVVDHVDLDTETVYVNRSKDEIKNSPEFDEETYREESYRSEVGTYYGPGGAGYRETAARRMDDPLT